jgi:hypothetical protein
MTTNKIEENVVPQTNNEKKMRSLHNKSIMECCGIRCMGSAAGAYVCVSLSSLFPSQCRYMMRRDMRRVKEEIDDSITL